MASARSAVASSDIASSDNSDTAIDAYEAALVELASEIVRSHRLQRVAVLDKLHRELVEKADAIRRAPNNVKTATKSADAARVAVDRADPSPQSIAHYDSALDHLDEALAKASRPAAVSGIRDDKIVKPVTPKCDCDPSDPLCPCLPGE